MNLLTDVLKAFLRGMSRSRLSQVGAVLATVLFPGLLLGTMLDVLGVLSNPYFGFAVYLVMGPLFILGLLLIPVGLVFFRRKEKEPVLTMAFFQKHLRDPERYRRAQLVMALLGFLTVLNVVIVSLFSYTGFHYTESVAFCGTFCHSVMHPEYTAYKHSPHSRVRCVECHIGEGAKWFAKSKISGARQFFAVAFNTYSRPIETPIHGLRPARETCEQCHRPEFFFGEKLYVKDKYLPDEENTHVQTVLLMKVGSGGGGGHRAHGIHWHVSDQNEITYEASDYRREQIYKVSLNDENGERQEFATPQPPEEIEEGGPWSRTMDCVDCHNRPTHIYLSPSQALDHELAGGTIPTGLPFIKRQAEEVISQSFDTTEQALATIDASLREWYGANYAELVAESPESLEQAIAGVQQAFTQNAFPEMRIEWGTYQNHLGHPDYVGGCFRCHDDEHETADGRTISGDCDLCHVILAEDESDPEILSLVRGDS